MINEVYRRPLVIAVYEPKWFMKVVGILKERGIPHTYYYSPDELPMYSILYTDYELFTRDLPAVKMIDVYYDPGHDCRILEKAILASMLKERYNELSIGIDPGPNPYMIILGDGRILYHSYVWGKDLTGLLSRKIRCYPAERIIVRVGGGSRGLELASSIKESLPYIRVEVVDEKETTPKNRGRLQEVIPHLDEVIKPYRNKDAYAALRIALRRGLEVV